MGRSLGHGMREFKSSITGEDKIEAARLAAVPVPVEVDLRRWRSSRPSRWRRPRGCGSDGAAAAAARPRRGGAARRPSRRAAPAALRLRLCAGTRERGRIRGAPPAHPAPGKGPSTGPSTARHLRRGGAVHDLAEGLARLRRAARTADPAVAGVGLLRARPRPADGARDCLVRRGSGGVALRGDDVRAARRAPGGGRVPDAVRRVDLLDPGPREPYLGSPSPSSPRSGSSSSCRSRSSAAYASACSRPRSSAATGGSATSPSWRSRWRSRGSIP